MCLVDFLSRRRFFTAAATFAAVFALSAQGVSWAENTLEQAREQGYIRIGFANEAPYGYATQEGRLTGEAPEIAKVVLKRMGVEQVDGVLTEFGSLIPGLKAGRFDIIAAGMYVLPNRCRQVAFSEPSYSIGEGFLVPRGNPKDLHSYQDVKKNPDITLGLMAGSVEVGYAQKLGIPMDQMKFFPDGPSAAQAVVAGRVDAYAGTSLTVNDLSQKLGDKAEVATPFEDPVIDGKKVRGYGAFAFRKEDKTLREAFNKELKEFLGTQEHLELVEPFGFTERELPGAVTTAELCATAG